MQRLAYRDFDEFADSISGVAGRFVPTARSAGDWWIEKVRVGRIELQRLQIGGATTFAGDGVRGYITLGIPLTDPSSMRIDGHSLADNIFTLVKNDQPFTFSARQLTRWVGVTLPLNHAHIDSQLRDAAQLEDLAPGGTRAQAEPTLLERLRTLVSRVCADDESVKVIDPVASVSAEEEVLHAAFHLLEASSRASDRHVGRPQVSRTRVIARCLELIDATDGQPLFIDDLCNATQVSERTLRNIFQEYFGVGPMRLLKVRQLREIRSALLNADPALETVTKIAARFGVWDFSLFARNYRALFAEAPSETLRRPRDRTGPPRSVEGLNPTWIGYAARRFIFAMPAKDGGAVGMPVDAATPGSGT